MAKHFRPNEIVGLDPVLVEMLDEAREVSAIPFFITCGFVTEQGLHVSGSAHLRGKAVDLRCAYSNLRFLIVTALLSAGFKRIGLYDRHIHADIDTTLPQDVIWVGTSK
jgi:hypothetical protein